MDSQEKVNFDIAKACKQLIRKYGDFFNIEAKYSENIYYSTDEYSVKNGDDKIFTFKVTHDERGTAFDKYDFSFMMDYRFSLSERQTLKLKSLHRMLKRKAEKQKKILALRNEAVQKLNNSVQFVQQHSQK